MEIEQLVKDFAWGMVSADSRGPTAVNQRGIPYAPGIGPHEEALTVSLVMKALSDAYPETYLNRYSEGVPYSNSRQKCDLCFGSPSFDLAVEVKMIRLLGDNGKPNDNLVTHILSPYAVHRSALTDVSKLSAAGLADHNAILVYAYDHAEWPSLPLVEAFEKLASEFAELGPRHSVTFGGLIHPVHQQGTVYGWTI